MIELKEVISIIIIVLFVSTYLSIFFFTYGATIEKEVVIEQVDYIVDDFVSDMNLMSPEYLQVLKQKIKAIRRPNLQNADTKAKNNNNDVVKQTMTIIGVALVVGLVGAYIASRYFDFDYWNMIKKNIILLAFVAATEISFLMIFGRNYMSADPNFVKLTILNKLTSK